MDFVSGPLGSVVIKLGKLLKEEYKIQTDLRNKIMRLSRDLESMHAVLRKVADVPPEQVDEPVKLWARDVRELSYNVEDILDTFFLVNFDGREACDPNKFKRAAKKIGKLFSKSKARHQIARMIESINKQADLVAERHRRYRAEDIVSKPAATSTNDDPRFAAMHKDVTQLVGIDKPRDELVSRLSLKGGKESKLKMKMVSVLGAGGLGKTTLAKAVYEKHKGDFQCAAFVSVGQKPDLQKVFRDILIALGKKAYRNLNIEIADKNQLVYQLQNYLGSKSAKGRYTDNQLDKVSDKVLKKCDGIPLAIITMASLLKKKPKEIWLEVCDSIGFRDTVKILSLSYYDLPYHLKTCLLYLSAFPEDYVIEKISLIWKWVAEGFVEKDRRTGFFEVAEGYFNELIDRSLIQAVRSEENGIVYGCRVHDMVLDLLRIISQEENFVTISNNDEGMSSSSSTVRRLANENRTLELSEHHMDLGHLRSLIASSCNCNELYLPSFKLLRVLALENCKLLTGSIPLEHLKSLVHLRYLGLRETDISNLPEEIGTLKFLQALDLTNTSVEELPSSVGLLSQLVCLRAQDAMVPNGVIEKLTSLEELHIRGGIEFLTGLHKLSELRVLKANIYNCVGVQQISVFTNSISKLHKMQHLDLRGIYDLPEMWEKGVLSPHLRHFILPSSQRLTILPACISHSDLPNLTHLELKVYPIEGWHMKILGELPELCHLKLNTEATARNVATVTIDSTGADYFFKKLRYCMLRCSMVQFCVNEDSSVSFTMWNGLVDVAFDSKTRDRVAPAVMLMPNLVEILFYLRVQHMIDRSCSCDNLGLEYLPSLQKVRVLFMTEGTDPDGRKKVKDALKNAMEVHPNKPTVDFSYFSTRLR
ncbi:hypothetical protein PR202_ga22677 [Eleusine coracana subsp. coracana]|uniref:Uncharacterized protein n=1 Tax=Eleusine coracana subsp. coracana TaxID=191504 RepID=A0AAV5D453_ELECO|nr:hypothetical protein PR202_ga22677 [Eleusine coracana subsp. coracana]